MKPGRELDTLIAEKVLGMVPCDEWKMIHHGFPMVNGGCEHASCYPRERPARYSISREAAFQVIDYLRNSGKWSVNIRSTTVSGQHVWEVSLYEIKRHIDESGSFAEIKESLPLAICLIALRACEVEVE